MTACKSNLKNIGTALEMYATDYEGKYPKNLDQLKPNYLKTIPQCYAAGEVTYKAEFGPKAPGNSKQFEDYFLLRCDGENHSDVNVAGGYPRFDSEVGLIERP